MNNAEMIVRGLKIPPLDDGKYELEEVDAFCGITGKRIVAGYRAQKIVSSNTGEFLDLLHGRCTGYLSPSAAMAFKGSWNLGSRLIFGDGTMFHPLISNKSAVKQDRHCWSDLVREVWPERVGQECLVIVATDFRKKVWPWSKTGILGDNTPVLLFDTGVLTNLHINWSRLIDVLNTIEFLYNVGFSKSVIASNLWEDYKTAVNFNETGKREEELCKMRELPEFRVAVTIAQKKL